jgi:hypothetical protein
MSMANSPFKPEIDGGVLVAKIAQLAAQGTGIHKIAEIIETESGQKISWRQVKKIISSDRCKDLMQELTDSTMAVAKTQLRSETARMVGKIIRTIEYHLDEKNLNAVPHALKIIGIEQEEGSKGQQNITVVLPGSPTEKPTEEIEIEKSNFGVGSRDPEDS